MIAGSYLTEPTETESLPVESLPTAQTVPSIVDLSTEGKPALKQVFARTRTRRVEIDVPPWQEGWPVEAQAKCFFQRRELSAAQACIKRQKSLITQLRHELRLAQRVMKLKHEAKLEGILQVQEREMQER